MQVVSAAATAISVRHTQLYVHQWQVSGCFAAPHASGTREPKEDLGGAAEVGSYSVIVGGRCDWRRWCSRDSIADGIRRDQPLDWPYSVKRQALPKRTTPFPSIALMPIRINCQCGKALNVPETMAGKAVKCPGCGKPVKVPAAAGGAASAAPAQPSSRMDDLFNEEGFSEHVAAVCPACRREMDAGAVLCTNCGYNKESGEQLAAHMTAGVDIDHGTLALQKAELDMVKDREMQAKLIAGAGLPWWGLALVLFMLSSGLTIAVLAVNASRRVDETINFNPVGMFLTLIAVAFGLVALGAYWMIVVHAFKNLGKTGLLALIPPWAIYYVCKNPKPTWKFLAACVVLGGISGGLFAAAASQGGV